MNDLSYAIIAKGGYALNESFIEKRKGQFGYGKQKMVIRRGEPVSLSRKRVLVYRRKWGNRTAYLRLGAYGQA